MTSIVLGQGWGTAVTNAPEPTPVADEMLLRVLLAVEALQATFAQLPTPQVHLEPNDFTDIVTAVQDLKGPNGPSAEDIALAIREVLVPALTPARAEPDLAGKKMLEVLERLDFRMKGQIISGGPGAVRLTNTADQAVPVTGAVTNLYQDSLTKQAFCATYTSSGDHDAVTPTTGNKIRLLYVTFTASSDNTLSNAVSVGWGTTGGAISTELYRAYAAGHGAVFDGAVNQSLIVNTQTAEKVLFTAHYQEVTP